MNNDARDLRHHIARLEIELERAKASLDRIERGCCHQWSEARYTPDIRKGYHIEGDLPGTMGIDRQLPMDVPRQETPKWTRECTLCGKIEVTTQTTKKVSQEPRFPS